MNEQGYHPLSVLKEDDLRNYYLFISYIQMRVRAIVATTIFHSSTWLISHHYPDYSVRRLSDSRYSGFLNVLCKIRR